jgi:transcriptional regulator with AAA-type ATPase domain
MEPDLRVEQLTQQLQQADAALNYERDRQTALRPYLVNKVQRGIVGTSRYAVRLRQEIKLACADRRSVLLFGEPGLEKDNMAALIHFGSVWRQSALIKVDCNLLQSTGVELFGRVDGKPGLLEWVGEGTLVLNNLEMLPPSLQAALVTLLATQTYAPVPQLALGDDLPPSDAPIGRTCGAKIIMVSEKMTACLETKQLLGHTVKVPPLRVRKPDMAAQVWSSRALPRKRCGGCRGMTFRGI